MPELPEVETMKRGLGPIVGGTIDQIEFPRHRYKPIVMEPRSTTFRRRVLGKTVTGLERRGKRLLVLLNSNDAIVFEPRMTGLLLLADPPSEQHVRAVFHLRRHSVDHFAFWDRRGLGTMRLMDARQREVDLGVGKLGPDALRIRRDELRAQLGHRRTPIKVALLNQVYVAGIGNLYASEILHVARTHPRTPCASISARRWTSIHAAIRSVLEQAIAYEGSTLSDGTYRNALNQQGGYQNHHRVYQRHDQPCKSGCGATVRRIVQAQRSTFYCPRCQRSQAGRRR